MNRDRIAEEFGHEQLHVFRDPVTGVTGAVAVHSTALGPAMGGLRLFRYPTLSDGLIDALRLARAMSFKNAAAGLDLGGGKAVVLDDGEWAGRREQRMRAIGEVVESLGGCYVTAEDVGTTPEDMDLIAAVTRYVAGCTAGRGDPSPHTARTVFAAIESAVRLQLGAGDLDGIRVGVQGAGHVGSQLVSLLMAAGARVYITDIDHDRALAVAAAHGAEPLGAGDFLAGDFDVLAPCALGGAIGPEEVGALRARVIAGAANNQLAERRLATDLWRSGILYVPDFLANCGGIIHVGAEVLGLDDQRVEQLMSEAIDRTDRLLREAAGVGKVPMTVAEEYAEARLRKGGAADEGIGR